MEWPFIFDRLAYPAVFIYRAESDTFGVLTFLCELVLFTWEGYEDGVFDSSCMLFTLRLGISVYKSFRLISLSLRSIFITICSSFSEMRSMCL